MFKKTYTRHEHFAAWLLCSTAAWLGGLGNILAHASEHAGVASMAAVVSASVIVTAVLFYNFLHNREYIFRIGLGFTYLHILFFFGIIYFFGLFVKNFGYRNPYMYDSVVYLGTRFVWEGYWPWFVLATLLIISLIAFHGWGRALKLK